MDSEVLLESYYDVDNILLVAPKLFLTIVMLVACLWDIPQNPDPLVANCGHRLKGFIYSSY